MRISIPKIKIKKDFDRITFLHGAHFLFFAAVLFFKMFYGINHWGSGLIKMTLLCVVYSFYYRTLKNLFYTFWSFSVGIGLYLFITALMAFFSYEVPLIGYLCLLAIFFLLWEVYLISSPIYYPLVHWWEFDFRYRHDLKIETSYEGLSFPGRLTDLRRGAGCVVSFDDFPLNKNLSIKTVLKHGDEHFEHVVLTGEIKSKRPNSIGRGITYGVKFLLKGEHEKNSFKLLSRYWQIEKRARLRRKFSNDPSSSIAAS